MKIGALLLVAIGLIVGILLYLKPTRSGAAVNPSQKKLLLFQQQIPTVDYVTSHPTEVNALPYEGIFFSLPSIDSMRAGSVIPVSQFTQELATYKAMHTQLTKVRHNFVYVRLVKTGPFATQTANTAQSLANLAQAARDAGLTGIAFDNEDYENDIWDPSITCPGKDAATCQQEAVISGKEVMQAVIAKWPDVVFISMLGPYFGDATTFQSILHEAPQPKHLILGAYTIGMNEATIGTNATYVDGGEKFSVHTSAEADADYILRKQTMPQSSPLIPASKKSAWTNALSLAFTLYDEQGGTPARWQEDIHVNAQASDEYAWVFSFNHVWLGAPGSGKQAADSSWIQATVTGRTQAGMSPYPTTNSPTTAVGGDCTRTVTAGSSIQAAVNASSAGDTVCVESGTYKEAVTITKNNVRLVGHGATITADSSATAHMVSVIGASNVEITGFTIDGLQNGQPADTKNLWIQSATGTHIHHNTITNGGGECVRILGGSTQTDFSYNTIKGCGAYKYGLSGSKNGEGVYIGIDPEQIAADPTKYKGYGVACAGTSPGGIPCHDQSNSNHIYRNAFDTKVATSVPNPQNASGRGNECVDIKEGAEQNLVEYNTCTGQQDADSAGMDTRGSNNVFSHNSISGVVGAAIRIGAEVKNSYSWVAEQNDVIKNDMKTYGYSAAVKVANSGSSTAPHQGVVCGNTSDGTFTNKQSEVAMSGTVNPACDGTKGTVVDNQAAGIGSQTCVGASCAQTPQLTDPPSSACATKSSGDSDCNSTISLSDFAEWRSEYLGDMGADRDGDGNAMDADFNGDAKVTLADYQVWVNGYKNGGGGTNPTPVPTTPPVGNPEIVPIPTSPGSLSFVDRPGYYIGDRVNCSTKEPICAMGWQEDDVYVEPRHRPYPAKVEWRNIQTGAVVKTVNLPDVANAPINGARVYPIYNPDNNNWFVVYEASRKGGASGDNQTSIYGTLFDAAGNPQGSAIEVYDGDFSGWVPHGYYDSSSKLFYMEWHQQTSSIGGRKDITAALVDGSTGALVKTGLKLHDTPENLEEYSGSTYNSVRGEGLSMFAANTGDCDEGCLTKATINIHTTSQNGLSIKGSQIDIDNNPATFEWYISVSFNPTTKRYLVVYGQSSAPYRSSPPITVKAHILDMDGQSLSGELTLGQATSGNFYWQTGTGCSMDNNLCLVAFKDKAVYVDTTKTDSSAVGSVFGIPTGTGTAKVAYSPVTKQFMIFGSAGYTLANGK